MGTTILVLGIVAIICAVAAVTSAIRLVIGVIKDDCYFDDFAWQIAMIATATLSFGLTIIIDAISKV